jgi:hypothetical protein
MSLYCGFGHQLTEVEVITPPKTNLRFRGGSGSS